MTESDLWDAAARARVSDRWLSESIHWNTAMTDALLVEAALTPNSTVLDVAAGSGDPALTIAQRLKAGRVIALDSSCNGLLLASAHARRIELGSRVVCLQGDAHSIPLAQNSVDCITCRCGVMFFDDCGVVMSEMLRVLKPGGNVALLAWGKFEQPFFDATVGIVLQLVRGAEMPSEARKMFRFAVPGALSGELRAVGFSNVHEQSLRVPRIWAGTPKELWKYQQQVSTLCDPLFASIPAGLKAEVDAKVLSALARFETGRDLRVPVDVILARATKEIE